MGDLAGISFDESDANLFQVDDPRLKADALRHSVLPRLHALLNESIARVDQIYQLAALDDSIVSFYPHFRTRRDQELRHSYDAAYVGLGGQRTKGKWHGFARKDGKEVQILPFRLGFQLTEDGLSLCLENYWLTGLTDASYGKLFAFHLAHEPLIHSLCYWCRVSPTLYWGPQLRPLSTLADHYHFMLNSRLFDNSYYSSSELSYPIHESNLDMMSYEFSALFIIYDSYIQIAKGIPARFTVLLDRFNSYLEAEADLEAEPPPIAGPPRPIDSQHARQAAAQRVRVAPAIRWQVFQRDAWRCVACGRGAPHDVILHVDHIVPRSLGGADTMGNMQTLCHECNLGKGNRDDTDLRSHAR